MASSIEVADAFVKLSRDHGGLTHIKLQKLTFIANAYSLAITNTRLVTNEDPICWKFGAVWKGMFEQLSHHKNNQITEDLCFESSTITTDAQSILTSVYEAYGDKDNQYLCAVVNESLDQDMFKDGQFVPHMIDLARVRDHYIDLIFKSL